MLFVMQFLDINVEAPVLDVLPARGFSYELLLEVLLQTALRHAG